jgi:tRNA(Ile)-lysidine synthase
MTQLWLEEHPGPTLRAVHVDHGLQESAAEWRGFCEHLCNHRAVPLSVHRVEVSNDLGQGVEAAARKARYEIFEAELGQRDTLLLAHHEDDQIETVLQRLFRGTGPRGIVGMPVGRPLGKGRLYRPLLEVSRTALDRWVADRGLDHVEDPTNRDSAYDRGVLRTQVLPVIAERWPGYRDSIRRFSTMQRDLIDRLPDTPLVRSSFDEPVLELDTFNSVEQIASGVHAWLTTLAVISPPQRRLHEFARQCLEARDGALPRLSLAEGEVIGWRARVYFTAAEVSHSGVSEAGVVGSDIEAPWGTVVWVKHEEQGLRLGSPVQFRNRLPGEKVTPMGGVQKDFGQLCQERGVPPWWRERLPIMACEGVAAWAPGLGLLAGVEPFLAHAGDGLMPSWRP